MRVGQFFEAVGWRLLVVLLPITSLPLVARFTGSSVAPPAVVVLLLFVLLWLIPHLLRRGQIPRQNLPLFAFGGAALISCVAAFFIPFPPFKEASLWRNELEGLVTLAVGICFALLVSTWVRNERRIALTLRWINWSGLAILLMAAVEIITWYLNQRYPAWLYAIHDALSVGPLYKQRPTAFSMEPSWLANQLNMLYLPIWLAAVTCRRSAHRWAIRGFGLESLLLAGGMVVLFFSLSRVGLLAFMLMAAYLILRLNFRLLAWLGKRVAGRSRTWASHRRLLIGLMTVILLTGYVAAGLGIGYGLSRLDPRMKDLFNFSLKVDDPFLHYARQLTFASRVVYWQAGWEVFNRYPILGTGLGNAGFFFQQTMPGFGWGLVEVRKLMYRTPGLPNIKNLWVRILAETGLIGFVLFATWLVANWFSSDFIEKAANPSGLLPVVGLAGKFSLVALVFEGFSVDSFALPYLWFMMGLVAAAAVMVYPSHQETEKG